MKIADLFAEVGFKIDTIKLHEVSKLISELNLSSLIATGTLVALGEGIKGLIEQSSQASIALANLNANTGIDTTFAQQFEDTAEAMGSTKEAAAGLISSLAQLHTTAMMGGGIPKEFAMMGFTVQDFMGTYEQQIKKINQILSTPIEGMSQAQREHLASFKSMLLKGMGGDQSLLRTMELPDLQGRMSSFLTLSQKEINDNLEATYQWRAAVRNINTELLKMVSPILPEITNILKGFNEGNGFKTFLADVKAVSDFFYKIILSLEIISNYSKAGLLNIGSTLSQPLIAAAKFGNQLFHTPNIPPMSPMQMVEAFNRAMAPNKAQSLTVHAPITIHAKDGKDVVKELEDWWHKIMAKTSREFGLGQT